MEGGKISLALGGSKKGLAPTNGVKRTHASLREDEDDGGLDHGRAQTVSHFDKTAGGAIDESAAKKDDAPMIIAPQANRDWREASKRRKQDNSRSSGPPRQPNGVDEEALRQLEESKKPKFGLNVADTTKGQNGATNGHDESQATGHALPAETPQSDSALPAPPRTAEEEAMDALLGNKPKSDLVLPAMSEEEAFSQDFRTAPDMSTLDDYARVPVEQFGAALLRGMGWKDGEGIGAQRGRKIVVSKMPERRPALLGIGAKEEAAVAQEMGSWGKAAKGRKAQQTVYNPVLLRDKKTGEMFTEEELQKKQERETREKYEEEFERKERKRREKEREDDEYDSHRSRRREGEREGRRDDKGRRRRDLDDERGKARSHRGEHRERDEKGHRSEDEESRRRERRREDEYYDDKYDRERSLRHGDERERRNERRDDRRRRDSRDRRR